MGRRWARPAAWSCLLLVLVACTEVGAPDEVASPSTSADTVPAPVDTTSLGDRVAVIVGPPSHVAPAEAAALRRTADGLAADPPDGVRELRVVQARTAAFTADLVGLLVDDGYGLVCVVGTGAGPLLVEAARARREATFCGTDGSVAGAPVNVRSVALDAAALVEVGAVALGASPAPVGLLVAEQLGDVPELTARFTSSVTPPTQPPPPDPVPVPELDPSPAVGPEAPAASPSASPSPSPTAPSPSPSPSPSPTAPPLPPFVTLSATRGPQAVAVAAEQLAEQRPSRALVLAPTGGPLAAATLGAVDTELVVVADWAVDDEGQLPGNLLVALTVDWGALLRAAVVAAQAPDGDQLQLFGLADGILGALPGQVEGAAEAAQRTTARIDEASAG